MNTPNTPNTPAVAVNLPVNFDDSAMVQTLKATVAKGCTNEEFAVFAQHCKATGLNPFKGEVWCIKTKDRAQIMTGINGYFSIANNHPAYDGMEIETSREGNAPVQSVCKVYRKDRSRPAIGRAIWSEDSKPWGVWKEKPTLMLEKVAKARALREAFPQELNGTYTPDEMPAEYAQPVQQPQAAPMPEGVKPADQVPQVAVFYQLDGVDANKRPDAEKLLKAAGAVYLPACDVWQSPKPIAKLRLRLITEAEANARAKAKSGTMERVKQMAAQPELVADPEQMMPWEVEAGSNE